MLDASAIIALIYREPGYELVEQHLPNSMISSVNLTEVASFLIREGNELEKICDLLQDLALMVVDYDEQQAFISAGFFNKTKVKGLSLGDRACLALGFVKGLPVLTADRIWKEVSVGVKVECIR